jgi:hypothetical protein
MVVRRARMEIVVVNNMMMVFSGVVRGWFDVEINEEMGY